MGQYSWIYDGKSTNDSVAYLDVSFPSSIVFTGDRYDFTMPIAKMKTHPANYYTQNFSRHYDYLSIDLYDGTTRKSGLVDYGNSNTVANSSTWASASAGDEYFTTSRYFNSTTSTQREIEYQFKTTGYVITDVSGGIGGNAYTSPVTVGNVTFILNVPPTFSNTNAYFDTPYIYANLTTVSVDVSDMTAFYGGYITEAKLTIGQQTDTLTGDDTDILSSGTLEIALASAGTFIPTVTVTDSRGQTTTTSLTAIAVNQYVAPSVSFTATRTDETGTVKDEGACALLNTSISWTSAIATLTAPTVSITDMDGTAVTATTTWYTDSALTTAVTDWTAVSSMPIYGLIDNTNHDVFDLQKSYQIIVTPNCSLGSGTALTQTLASAFYTIDFLAGGHGIAFGQPASDVGFECNMPTTFHDTVDIEDDVTVTTTVTADDFYIDLSDYQTTGSVDKELYDAIVALGWDSDVLVN